MTLLIDTRSVEAEQRVEFWANAASGHYHPLRIRTDREAAPAFEAQMWGERLGSLGVLRISAAANTMTRTWRDVAVGDPERLHVSLLLRGGLHGEQQGREAVLRAGDITTYDTSAPVAFRAPGRFDLLVLTLPKRALGRHADRISRLTAVAIPGQAGLPRLAAHFFRGVAAGRADGSISEGDTDVAEQVLQLVRGLYAGHGATQPARRPSRATLLDRAQAFMAQNLGDPGLGPEQVARACFISTRYLHRVFAEEDLSVCDWIRAERLARCRQDLLDPALASEAVAAIGTRWGLPSPQHFSRLFRAAYGCSPREFRRTVHASVA